MVGLAVLLVTVLQRARTGGSPSRFPRPTRGQMGTVLAWVIIALLAYVAMLTVRTR